MDTDPPPSLPTTNSSVIAGSAGSLYADVCQEIGAPVDEVLRGTPFARKPLPRWVAWEHHVLVNDRLLDSAGCEKVLFNAVSRVYGRSGFSLQFVRIAGLLAGRLGLLRSLCNLLNSAFLPALRHDVEVDGDRICVVVRIPEDLEASRAYLVADVAAALGLFRTLSLKVEHVDWIAGRRWARLEVRLARRQSLFAALRQWWLALRGARHTVDLLAARTLELEQALAESREATRRAECAHDEAERARHHALDAIAARDRFLAVVSHELRTPLHQITGSTALLLHETASGEQRELLTIALKAARQLEARISDILAVREDDEELTGPGETVGLQQLATELVVPWRDQGNPVTIEAGEGLVHLPLHALGAILDPLIDNGLSFGDQVFVHLFLVGPDLVIDVIDDGPGLGEDTESLFEPFVLGSDVDTRDHGGLGLGLPLARKRTHLLGGTLQVVPTTEGTHLRVFLRDRAVDDTPSLSPEALPRAG